jgi:hypothetical protein
LLGKSVNATEEEKQIHALPKYRVNILNEIIRRGLYNITKEVL